MKTFNVFGIDLCGRTGVEVQTTCPQCSPRRKKSKARCLSVNTEKGIWVCHHCDWAGTLKGGVEERPNRQRLIIRPTFQAPSNIPVALRDAFAARGISEAVLQRNRIALGDAYIPQCEAEVACIQFPFYKGGQVVNIKYRALQEKAFRQVAHAEKILYGVDDLTEDWAVIVEGEIDKLSLEVAGIRNAVSVPDGAPPAGSKPSDAKFECLQTCEAELVKLNKIILGIYNDPPGKTLQEELARRLGPERCWRVSWPHGCKDANDVLLKYGPEDLRRCIEDAKPYPIEGVLEIVDIIDDVMALYEKGLPGGVSTGWKTVDQCYTVKPGEMTIVTGIPSHGKSEWLDALIVNLADRHDWVMAVFSPENYPPERHIAKLVEKYVRLPFRCGPRERMNPSQLLTGLQWAHDHFTIIAPEDAITIDSLLQKAKSLVTRRGIRGFVLDPWNELDHRRPASLTETEYVSECLGKIRRFARVHAVHVWVVAHPMKLRRRDDDTYPIPTPYDISGSAHWRNKADNCLTVWRDEQEVDSPVMLYVQKIRFREVGQVGAVPLRWIRLNGRYEEAMAKDCETSHWQERESA